MAVIVLLFGFGFAFLFATTLIILHNRKHFKGLASLARLMPDTTDDTEGINKLVSNVKNGNIDSDYRFPLVSILIPARNEEQKLSRLLASIEKQNYSRLEIHVLDDHSEDRTQEIANDFASASRFPVVVHAGLEKPDGWLGKNWACHQLAGHAAGDVLIFLDADTWIASTGISEIMNAMRYYELDFATVWPHQVMHTSMEKAVVSNVYATIATYLPTLYSYRAPRWIPTERLRNSIKPMFATACGQCMIFTRDAYKSSGGHAFVRDQVVEDVMIARQVVRSGNTMRMFHGTDRLWCRMYQSHHEIFNGFRKNFFAGFGYRLMPFLLAWLIHLIVYIMPPFVLLSAAGGLFPDPFQSAAISLSAALIAIPFLQRVWVSRFLKWPVSTALLYLPGIFWFQMLAIVVIRDRMLKTGTTWKGRQV